MANHVYLAIDLGAESGRVMAGIWNGKTIRLEEVHRFPNGPVALGNSIRWDVLRLWADIQNGLSAAAAKFGPAIASVGVDTWGVDYVLMTKTNELLGKRHGAIKVSRRENRKMRCIRYIFDLTSADYLA